MSMAPFSISDALWHMWGWFIGCPSVTSLITLWHFRRIGIRGLLFRPFSTLRFKTRYTPFIQKSQQRVIVYYFSLKGWGARKSQHEFTDIQWFAWIFTSPDLAVACSLQYGRQLLSRWNSTRKTVLYLGPATGIFPGKVPICQSAHKSDVLRCNTFHN
jgi:hypothetical protein